MTLIIAEPWDLVGPTGRNRFAGSVEQTVQASEATNRDTVVLRLHPMITYEEAEYEQLVLQAREGEPLLERLRDGQTVEVRVYGVPASHVLLIIDPANRWRGGLGATASAVLA